MLGDSLGSTTLTVNATTGAVATKRYLPYGKERSSSGTQPTERGWIGQTRDDATGLLYLNNRYYDPTIGRFTATDPLGDLSSPGSLDAYGYAGGSPVTSSDRTGLAFCLDNGNCNKPIVRPPGGGPTGTERRQQCIVSCTGQALVNVIENDSSGLGDAVFGAIDVANQGNFDDLDGNWSSKDIAAAMAGRNLDDIAAQMGFSGAEADGFVALVRDVAARLHGREDLWEKIDKEDSWWDRNGGTVKTIGKGLLMGTAIVGGIACSAATAGVCGTAVSTLLVTGGMGAAEEVGSYLIDNGGDSTVGGAAQRGALGFLTGGSTSMGVSFNVAMRTGKHSAGITMTELLTPSRFDDYVPLHMAG